MVEHAVEWTLASTAPTWEADESLVKAAQRDTEAAGRLFDKYYNRIFQYLYHCTFDHALTEDLTSRVFLAAFEHLERFRWKRIPFAAWLYRIATNEVRMVKRRQKRVRIKSLQDLDAQGREVVDGLSGAEASAEGRLMAEEEQTLLYQALLQLKPLYRTVIILRYFEKKTIADISVITGRREGTVKSQLHRGLARLQDILVRSGVLP